MSFHYLDLRHSQSLGYNPEQIPAISGEQALQDGSLVSCRTLYGGHTGVYQLPDQPNYLLRVTSMVQVGNFTEIEARTGFSELTSEVNEHFDLLHSMGVYIPAHRHLGARPSSSEKHTDLISITEKLPNYQELDPVNPEHFGFGIQALQVLCEYISRQVHDSSDTKVQFLSDIEKFEQWGISYTAQGKKRLTLHDVGPYLNTAYRSPQVMSEDLFGTLDGLANMSRELAQNAAHTPYGAEAIAIYQMTEDHTTSLDKGNHFTEQRRNLQYLRAETGQAI